MAGGDVAGQDVRAPARGRSGDPDRDAVYLAEDRLARLAAARSAMVVGGRVVAVEPELRFTTLAEAGLFCTLTCLELGLPPITVRRRRGERRSHYEPRSDGSGVVALASWGAQRLVVVHELAHHLVHARRRARAGGATDEPEHGPAFRAAMVMLLNHLELPRQAEALARFHRDAGLDEGTDHAR